MSADIHSLVGAYAVDAVDDHERAAFERHLAECPECRAEVAELRETAARLSLGTQVTPPTTLRDSVLAGIRTVRPLPPLEGSGTSTPAVAPSGPDGPAVPPSTSTDRDDSERDDAAAPSAADTEPGRVVPLRPRRRMTTWLASAAAAAAVLVGALAWSPWDDGGSTGQLTATEQVLRASDAQRYEKTIDGARATIVRSASLGKAVIIADNMPAAPLGKDFQIWLDIPGKGMVSAGLMPHDAKPTVTMPLEGDAALATGAGITMEPTGGSPAPTTEPIALFTFS
jgi:anti-sigma-K factor RskA